MSTPGDAHSESITAAAKALAKATSRLAKAMGSQASELVPDIQSGVSESLRQASETLNRAAERAATPKPAQSKAARTREELLLAAAQVFAEQGIEKASMGDIASKAGYTKGALYANFSSKQDLIRHVARSTDRVTAVEPEDAQELDCASDLPGVSDGTVDESALADWLQEAQKDTHLLLALELMAYGIRHPELRQEFADTLLTSHHALVTQVFRFRQARSSSTHDSTAESDTPDERDVDTATAILSIANHTALLNRLSQSEPSSPAATARIIARILASNDRT